MRDLPTTPQEGALPARPIQRLLSPLERFLHVEAASGFVLFGCTVVALALANSRFADAYQAFWSQPVRVSFGALGLDYPLWYWINDGLMTLFFFVIGLEIKREMVSGELSDPRKLVIPIAGALGGALVPVLVFLFVLSQGGGDGQRAWAVPMATDIAFVVGCLALLGKRVPRGLKVFVLSLAIVDDILAVIVIAAFYSGAPSYTALAGALAGFGVLLLLNRLRVRSVAAYAMVGVVIWLFMLKSGVHPTVAGVALGLLTPASAWLADRTFLGALTQAATTIQAATDSAEGREARRGALSNLLFASREATSPLQRLETGLHPWVAFVIMPVFALANAGVAIDADTLGGSLSAAVALALVVGKPVGICLFALLVVKLGWARLPEGASWAAIAATGCLAGIGFTMSLFVASLGLEGPLLQATKGGILVGSGVSLLLGLGLLHLVLPKAAPQLAAEA
jgi:Na+:H+ antiporter, NhaA family